MLGDTARPWGTGDVSCGKSVVELKKHLLYQPRPGLCPSAFPADCAPQTEPSTCGASGGFRVVTKDLFGQRGDTRDPNGTVGILHRGSGFMASLPMNQRSAWNDEAVNFLIAHSMMRKDSTEAREKDGHLPNGQDHGQNAEA